MSRRVTLQTIADDLDVSRTTVSNAYNRPDQLTPELRQRILERAEALGYRGPDAAARMLRTGATGTIGLLFTEDLRYVFTDPSTALFMQGVAETSALAGTGLTLLPIPTGMALDDTALGTTPVDGYLVFSVAEDHPVVDAIRGQERPVVIVDEPDLGQGSSFVGIDDRTGARMAAEHLIELGHRHFAILVHRLSSASRRRQVTYDDVAGASVRVARERVAGYRDAITGAGIDFDSAAIWEAGGNDPDAGREATLSILDSFPETTALLGCTDRVAIGATQAATGRGLRVPDDLSVLGFDDIPRAATWEPALTSIRQPLVDKGRAAAELLLAQIESGTAMRVELPVELVPRASTAPPPSGDASSPNPR